MIKVYFQFILLLLLGFISADFFAQQASVSNSQPWQAVENQHFIKLNHAKSAVESVSEPDISVTFYFWPGSASCYQVELALQDWQRQHSDIKVIRIPLVKRPHWRLLAKAYWVAHDLGIAKSFLDKLYLTIHQQATNIDQEAALIPLISDLNIDEVDFFARLHSPEINHKLSIMEAAHKQLPLTGVPSFIVNNQWLTDASYVNSSAQLFQVIDSLLAKTPKIN